MESRQKDGWAVGALLLGATLWGVMWWPLRYFEGSGLRGAWLSVLLYGILSLSVLPWAWRHHGEWRGRAWSLPALMLFGGWTNVAFVLAMLEGEVVRVLLLFYLSPVWSIVGGRLFLGERIGRRRVLIVLIALVGAVLMLGLDSRALQTGIARADWLALSSGVCFSLTNVVLRKEQGLGGLNKSWAVWLGCVVVAGFMMLMVGDSPQPVGTRDLLSLALFSLLWVGLATVVVQYGVSRMEVGRSGVLLLFELVAGTVSAVLLTSEAIGMREWMGGALIVGAALIESRASTPA